MKKNISYHSEKELQSQQTTFGWCAHLNRIKAQSIGGSVPGMPPAWILVMTGEQKQQNSLVEAGDGCSQQLVGLKNILLARLLAAIL